MYLILDVLPSECFLEYTCKALWGLTNQVAQATLGATLKYHSGPNHSYMIIVLVDDGLDWYETL